MPYAPINPTPPTPTEDMHDHSLMSLSFATFLLAVALYIASLFLPVFITQTNDIQGYWILAMGWLGFVTFQFAWYAAPFAVLAVYISRKSPQLGLVLSVIAIIMASEAFLFTEVPFGRSDKVIDYASGFYVWYLCFYLISISILLRLIAWGKVEEESSFHTFTSSQSSIVSAEQSLQRDSLQPSVQPEVVKATRKIIAPKKEIRSTTPQNWKRQTPPPLPMSLAEKKNIYRSKKTNKDGEENSVPMTEIITPPPLLKPKKKHFIKPPPLPNWYKTVVSRPPPLPEKALGIAPFLDQ